MSSFKIITDSASDLPGDFLQQHDIGVVPFYITIDGNTYLKDQVEITVQEFYRIQRERKQFFKTSLPSVQDYVDEFNKYAKQRDILCFCLSSKLSGSSQSAINAANIVKDEHLGRNVVVIDTLSASLGYGFKIMEAVKCRDKGMTLDQTVQAVSKYRSDILLAVDTLEYLQMGGRIGKAQALAGGLLNIKPIIKVVDGVLTPQTKVRGRSKVVPKLLELLDEAVGANASDYSIGVMHTDCLKDAEAFRDQIEAKYDIKGKVKIVDVGLVIGVHVGPKILALTFLKNNPDI